MEQSGGAVEQSTNCTENRFPGARGRTTHSTERHINDYSASRDIRLLEFFDFESRYRLQEIRYQ